MKVKTLENKRYSIIAEDLSKCMICGRPRDNLHEVYEGAKRIPSMKYGMVMPLCFQHHQLIHANRELAIIYKKEFQKKFEETHTRDEFIEIFKRSYL